MTDLNTFISERRHRPFVWGENDCCLFVADWLLAKGSDVGDIAAEFRGTYNSQQGAFKQLLSRGYNDIKTAFEVKLGTPVQRLMLRRGDVVLLDTNNGDVMGIFAGQCCFALAQNGVDSYSIFNIKQGWWV